MNEKQKIIFLDIDGPMIPTYVYLKNAECSMSLHRREFSEYSVVAINRICAGTGAKIVFNSYHNRHEPTNVGYINDDAIANGVHEEHIHADWKTDYPSTHNRYDAILDWVAAHGGDEAIEWIAIDDADFKDRAGDRLVLINPHNGINLNKYNKAMRLLGGKEFKILI